MRHTSTGFGAFAARPRPSRGQGFFRGPQLLLLFLFFSLAREAWAQKRAETPTGPAYHVEIYPENPEPGSVVRVSIFVESSAAVGMSLGRIDLDAGLSLESSSIKPWVGPRGDRFAEARLDFRVLAAGRFVLRAAALSWQGGGLVVGPLSIEAASPGTEPGSPAAWIWLKPERVYRFQNFALGLKPAQGPAAGDFREAVFTPPEGLLLEKSGALSFAAAALNEGPIALPPALIIDAQGKKTAEAAGSVIKVLPLPEALMESRAFGDFRFSCEGPEPRELEAGRAASLRLVLSGEGNLPILVIPEPSLILNARSMGADVRSSRRLDEVELSAAAYRGRAILEIRFTPSEEGRLDVVFAPLKFMRPDGEIAALEIAPLKLRVAASGPSGDFGGTLRGFAHEYADKYADGEKAMGLEKAASLWDAGARGEALALVYSMLRENPGSDTLRKAALACAGELGAAAPLLDLLPRPTYFALACASALLASALAFFAARRGRAQGSRAPFALAAAVLCLAAALVAGTLTAFSIAERRSRLVLVWSDRLLLVPSREARSSIPLPRGATARLKAEHGEFSLLELGDGVSGWAETSLLFFY